MQLTKLKFILEDYASPQTFNKRTKKRNIEALNNSQFVGPSLQKHLFVISNIFLRWFENLTRSEVKFYMQRFNPTSSVIYYKTDLRFLTNVAGFYVMRNRLHFRFGGIPHELTKDFFNILMFALSTEDVKPLIVWLNKVIQTLPIRKHRHLYYYFMDTIKHAYRKMGPIFNMVGIYFYVAGKLGTVGNARAAHIKYVDGLNSPMTLNSRVSAEEFVVRTVTGCSNFRLHILFKNRSAV